MTTMHNFVCVFKRGSVCVCMHPIFGHETPGSGRSKHMAEIRLHNHKRPNQGSYIFHIFASRSDNYLINILPTRSSSENGLPVIPRQPSGRPVGWVWPVAHWWKSLLHAWAAGPITTPTVTMELNPRMFLPLFLSLSSLWSGRANKVLSWGCSIDTGRNSFILCAGLATFPRAAGFLWDSNVPPKDGLCPVYIREQVSLSHTGMHFLSNLCCFLITQNTVLIKKKINLKLNSSLINLGCIILKQLIYWVQLCHSLEPLPF